jgi:hypothetical protein
MAIAAAVMSTCSIAWFRTSTQFSERYSPRLSVLLRLVVVVVNDPTKPSQPPGSQPRSTEAMCVKIDALLATVYQPMHLRFDNFL